MINFIISAIFLLFLSSCASNDVYKNHKIPVENQKFLNQAATNNIYPNTQPQYGNYSRPLDNNKFYDKVFDNKAKLQIHDEVANNKLPQIRTNKQNIPTPPSLRVKKPMPAPMPKIAPKISAPKKQSLKRYYIQVGAYSKVKNVQRTEAKVKKYGRVIFEEVVRGKKNITIVRIGPVPDLKSAIDIQEALYKDGFNKAIIREVN